MSVAGYEGSCRPISHGTVRNYQQQLVRHRRSRYVRVVGL